MNSTSASSISNQAQAASMSIIRRRSPLSSVFRAWHITFSIVALAFLLSMVIWKAFNITDIAVSLQQERLGSATVQTAREPVARLLQKLETVGGHARTIAATYKRISLSSRTGANAMMNPSRSSFGVGLGVCDAPTIIVNSEEEEDSTNNNNNHSSLVMNTNNNTNSNSSSSTNTTTSNSSASFCNPPKLDQFLAAMSSYPEALYFIRYAYISSGIPRSMYNDYVPPNTTTTTTTTAIETTSPTTTSSSMMNTSSIDPNSTTTPSSSSTTLMTETSSTSLAPTTTTAPTTTSSSSSQYSCTNQTSLFPELYGRQSPNPEINSVVTTNSNNNANTSDYYFWHECGCDLDEGCFYVDKTKHRRVFNPRSGQKLVMNKERATNLNGADYISFIKNLTKEKNSRGEWSDPAEYEDIYSDVPDSVELLLQFSVPLSFDEQTGECLSAASIDISTEFIASVLSVEEAVNATLFILDRRGPTLLAESSPIAPSRVIRRKFNPLSPKTLSPSSPTYSIASQNVKTYMPLFRQMLGGYYDSAHLPQNQTIAQVGEYSLAMSPVGDHWLLLQATPVKTSSIENGDATNNEGVFEYEFMTHGRLYLPVIIGAAVMIIILLIEFVHGTFPSAEWKFDDDEEEERRKKLQSQRALIKDPTKGGGASSGANGGAVRGKATTHRSFVPAGGGGKLDFDL